MQEIYVDDIGTGFPLVLVHGFLGSSAMWSPQKDFLSKYYRLIAPALPGFGESSNIKSLDSINAMAKSVLKILEKKKIKKFNLMGHSMGGMIAQEMAIKSGDKINKLICYATGSIGDIPGRFEPIDVSRQKLKENGKQKNFIHKNICEGNSDTYRKVHSHPASSLHRRNRNGNNC